MAVYKGLIDEFSKAFIATYKVGFFANEHQTIVSKDEYLLYLAGFPQTTLRHPTKNIALVCSKTVNPYNMLRS